MQYIIIFSDKNSKKAEVSEYFSFSQWADRLNR